MPYSFRKQRLCHLETSGRDRKRTLFWITPPAGAPATVGTPPESDRAHAEPRTTALAARA
jgi:hypothetical protein